MKSSSCEVRVTATKGARNPKNDVPWRFAECREISCLKEPMCLRLRPYVHDGKQAKPKYRKQEQKPHIGYLEENAFER